MSLISPNFDVKSIIFFPILARGLFRKLLDKALQPLDLKSNTLLLSHCAPMTLEAYVFLRTSSSTLCSKNEFIYFILSF